MKRMRSKANLGYSLIKDNMRSLIPYQVATYSLALITIIINMVLVKMMQALVDSIQFGNGTETTGIFWRLAMTCAAYVVFIPIFQFVFKRTQIIGANEVLALLYRRLQIKPLFFFQQHGTGEIVSLLNNEGKEVGNWLSSGLLVLLNEFTVLLLNFSMMLYYHVPLTLLLSTILFIAFVSSRVLTQRISKHSADSFAVTGKINAFLLQTLKAEVLIHILGRGNWFNEKFLHLVYGERYLADRKKANAHAGYMTIFALLSILLPIIAVATGAFMAAKNAISIGTVLAFYALTMQIQEPVRYIPDFLAQRKNAMALAERLLPIMEDTSVKPQSMAIPNASPHLTVRVASFAYNHDGANPLLENTGFSAGAGEIIVIKGGSGSGKSTLLGIIMGFIESDATKVAFNGIDLGEVSDEERWRHMLIAEQEPVLLDATLLENLLLGDRYTSSWIEEVIYTVCLEDFARRENADQKIGGDVEGVSGGQKQRIGLARILLRKPDVLVLDEPTSALDAATSVKLANRISAFAKRHNMILIVATHKCEFDHCASSMVTID